MEPPYSVWADLLNKFHAAPVAIQALWLVVLAVAAMHVASVAGQVLREALRILEKRWARKGRTASVLFQAPNGQWMLYTDGAVGELTAKGLGTHMTGPPRLQRD
jgi:hypothetical protein